LLNPSRGGRNVAKVGIVTFHYSLNYGAVLQAYGLAQVIETMGHTAQIVDYFSPGARRAYPRGFHGWGLRRGGLVANYLKRRRFNRFRKRYLPLSPRQYRSYAALVAEPPRVDCLVCGSDQVWNIHTSSCGGFDPSFFLGFAEGTGIRRISYAASFGDWELNEHRESIADLVSAFDHISVRDRRSERIVKALVGRKAVHVLDPSLLTDYSHLVPDRRIAEPYIFNYCVDRHPFITTALPALSKLLGMQIISVNPWTDGVHVVRSASPIQWLDLMKQAAFVSTNSFHGTCFALLWRKPFVVLPTDVRLFRIEDMLQTAGLSERLVDDVDQLASMARTSVDYQAVRSRLAPFVQRSLDFLATALGHGHGSHAV